MGAINVPLPAELRSSRTSAASGRHPTKCILPAPSESALEGILQTKYLVILPCGPSLLCTVILTLTASTERCWGSGMGVSVLTFACQVLVHIQVFQATDGENLWLLCIQWRIAVGPCPLIKYEGKIGFRASMHQPQTLHSPLIPPWDTRPWC